MNKKTAREIRKKRKQKAKDFYFWLKIMRDKTNVNHKCFAVFFI